MSTTIFGILKILPLSKFELCPYDPTVTPLSEWSNFLFKESQCKGDSVSTLVKALLLIIILFPVPFLMLKLSPDVVIVKLLSPNSTLTIPSFSETINEGYPILKYVPIVHISLVSSINTIGFKYSGMFGISLSNAALVFA